MRKFINYAHRGASEYYPENTFSSFFAGIDMGADGIETDVQKTKDGVLVLFHDDNLKRVTGVDAGVSDLTYSELMSLTVTNAKTLRQDKIVSLPDFIKYLGWRDLTFAVEIKQRGIVREVMSALDTAGMKDKVIITSFIYEELLDAKRQDMGFRLGWLYWGKTDEQRIKKLLAIDAYQACPKIADLTEGELNAIYSAGLHCRAWGAESEELMKRAVDIGVDEGITVNFPDKLENYLKSK